MIGLLQTVLVGGTVVAFAVWCLVVLAARTGAARHASTSFWLAPWWVPTVVLLGALAPGFAGLFGFEDHCLTAHAGGHHHPHLCVLHRPHMALGLAAWWALVPVWAWVLVRTTRAAVRAVAQWRAGSVLIASARPSELGDDVRLLEDARPMALAVGKHVLVSRGLVERARPETLSIVIAHERAHVARRDGWRAAAMDVLGAIYPSHVRRPMRHSFVEEREAACDDAAGRSFGRVRVAAALTEVARLRLFTPTASSLSVASGALELRVRRLLERGEVVAPPRYGVWLALLLLAASAGPGHSWLERLVALLTH